MKLIRKWSRILHRDLGYLFFGMTVIYALSGIALNHLDDWDPSYILESDSIQIKTVINTQTFSQQTAEEILAEIGEYGHYKNHLKSGNNEVRIFLQGDNIVSGSLILNMQSGKGRLEKKRIRQVFNQVNYLHYNPIRTWTWFADIFAGVLIFLAITGLIMVRGKNGITGRGLWLTLLGIIVPTLFLVFFK